MTFLATSSRENDLDIYCSHADKWWDRTSHEFRSLHGVNHYQQGVLFSFFGHDFSAMKVVDLGCGGGLFSIPLAQRGAHVTGVDISKESVDVARAQRVRNTTFFVADACETHLPTGSFDLALITDVLEHIKNWEDALREGFRLVRPGGYLFVSTLNKTWLSWLLAIQVCERLGLVPRGTHSYDLFIKPCHIAERSKALRGRVVSITGSRPRLLRTLREWTVWLSPHRDVSVSYTMMLRKEI